MGVRKEISFERVHRIGRKPDSNDANSRPRPIVAKLSNFKDREIVRKQASVTLRGTDFRVQEQFPPEIEERRKTLYPVMRDARRKKDKVRLVKDILYTPTSSSAPDSRNPAEVVTILSTEEETPGRFTLGRT
ncbi:hypothetical protein FSP39_019214 [Pinctada imbricata]|uniref:Uncharacterized protein n=1 Tax=Pinctada imbricata TaxID=66713 RepID=A0AA88Y852_PINIB|nr:hypothetical protein FSP39_019214 [Pinctada imbricata]